MMNAMAKLSERIPPVVADEKSWIVFAAVVVIGLAIDKGYSIEVEATGGPDDGGLKVALRP